jgi:hypothetical protein
MHLQRVCHGTLPWLISFSLDLVRAVSIIGLFTLSIVLVNTSVAQTPSPPQLLARPKAAFYPQGPLGSPVPVPGLLQAVMDNDAQQVEALLRRGANPNEAFAQTSPLEWAMGSFAHTDARIAELLLEHGANPNLRKAKNQFGQTNGWTPLFFAVHNKRSDLVAILLKHGAEVNIRDVQGKSPLDCAKEVKDATIIKQIETISAKHQ